MLTPDAFAKLLQWLLEARNIHDDSESRSTGPSLISDDERAGEEFEAIREKLISYFARRGCNSSTELTDETIARVAKRIMVDEQVVRSEHIPARFFYNTARYVFLEHVKNHKSNASLTIDDLPPSLHPSIDPNRTTQLEAERLERERRIDCLETCKRSLPAGNWEMILEYYQGETRKKIENRKRLAEKLKVTPNALNIRAHRVRKQLEDCLSSCFNRARGSLA